MAADPELTAETRAWLTKSANDLRAAKALIDSSPPLLDEAVSIASKRLRKRSRVSWRGTNGRFERRITLKRLVSSVWYLTLHFRKLSTRLLRSPSTHGDFAIPVRRKESMLKKPGRP